MTKSDLKFKMFIAHAVCCDSLILLLRPRAYVSCKCGNTSVDAGDGYYHRINTKHSTPIPKFYRQPKKGVFYMVTKTKKTNGTKRKDKIVDKGFERGT